MPESWNHFPEAAAAMFEALGGGVEDEVNFVVERAQMEAPVRTGFLRDSIHKERGEDKFTWNAVVGASYGMYVNFGTRHMPANPFFDRALMAAEGRFNEIMDKIAVAMENI